MSGTGFGRLISDLAAASPDRLCLFVEEEAYTLADLDRAANRLAREYQQQGVGHNQIVTIPLANGFPLLVAILAAWKVGAIPSPVSSRMPEAELGNLIACGNSALVVGVEPDRFPGHQCLPPGFEPDTSLSDTPLPELDEPGGERALASSGSTGRPKLIMPADKAVFDPAFISNLFKPEHATLVPGPLYHAVPFSATWQGLFNGCNVVVLKRFDAEKCLQLIEQHKVDRMWVVPTMMLRIWKLGETVRNKYDVSCLKNVLSGGAPLPPWLMQGWIDWLGPEVMNDVFGPSERIGGTMINGVEWLKHPGSVGRPLPYSQLKIVNQQGEECAPFEMGEIYNLPSTGPGTTYEYRGSEGNRDALGWESVGDMGYLDEDGYLYLGDRKTDMILKGGRNIYPAEVEAAIDAFDNVRSCAVIGVPDKDGENIIHAIIDSAGKVLDEEALRDFLVERLTPYKIPSVFEFVDEPLRNDAGKMRRSALRQQRMGQQSL